MKDDDKDHLRANRELLLCQRTLLLGGERRLLRRVAEDRDVGAARARVSHTEPLVLCVYGCRYTRGRTFNSNVSSRARLNMDM